jgi:hypothetical protein
MIVRHRTIWAAPAPLWPEARTASDTAARSAAIGRPAILRFASDEFMEELALTLERDPSQLAYLHAIPESWRNPAPRVPPPAPLSDLNRRLRQERRALPGPIAPAGAAEIERARLVQGVLNPPSDLEQASDLKLPFKLYHPAHQRFYLVAACLVCDIPGMPDHMLENGERAGFVVRRLVARSTNQTAAPHPISWAGDWGEYALVPGGSERAWVPADSTQLAAGEERLPLFPMNYIAADGRRRRLLAGMLPVARRDAYMAAPVHIPAEQPADPTKDIPPIDPRLAMLHNDIIQIYWTAKEILANAGRRISASIPGAPNRPNGQDAAMLQGARDQVQVATWYALLDFSSYLAVNLPQVRKAIGAPFPPEQPDEAHLPPPDTAKQAAEDALLDHLKTISVASITLDVALRKVEEYRTKLENTTQMYTNTSIDTDPDPNIDTSNPPDPETWPITDLPFLITDEDFDQLFDVSANGVTALEGWVRDALPTAIPLRTATPPAAAAPPTRAGDPAYFIVRCVYEQPNCGPLHPPALSLPTLAFEPASFFDPEAPARPIRISLPIDSTPGGLRKYTKSVALMLSDQLACQKAQLGGMTLGDLVLSVLPWPLHKDLPAGATDCDTGDSGGIGLMCSLSIPIITICALLLLIIIVNLLDIIFRWVPFFILCFPLPNFRGKKP